MTEVADNTLVDGRYRIVERIGSGGMADVYRAEDIHLGREVALKVLHRRFAQDQEFVERFRREASAAAGLQHPHVVGVYDRGQHEGTYYIAMEYLSGRPLKEIVEQEAPLAQERAIDLGVQILDAAGFAHRHGVIHRDFKPHNVIVDADGVAKVTDFGIARAGASEMTETGSIMGTAQYLSPEQAQGHGVTAVSDLYSIGVMLYEMLAGQLPFQGDSAVAIALKHLSEPPTPISALRPDVHPALEAVVMAALAKDPAQRWQTAEDFAAALEAARGQLGDGLTSQDTAVFAPVLPPPSADGVPVQERPERKRRWPWVALGVLVLALVAALVALALGGLAPEQKEVPRVVGKPLVEAREILERQGFEVAETRVRSQQDFDRVIDQDPDPGVEADEGSTVTLEVSDGPGTVLVPSVDGLSRQQAIDDLNDAGLKVSLDSESSDDVKKGFVIRTVPRGGEEVERGTRVRVFVSDGPAQVTVPDVTGLSRGSAEARLSDEGLGVTVREEPSADVPEGQVISQDPTGGTKVDDGTTVTITVSTGVEQVRLPDVVGLPRGAAARELRSAGLVTVERQQAVTDPAQDGVVLEQRPSSGLSVDKGSEVVLVVGVFTEPETPTVPETTETTPGTTP